jgi:hypothetical protein
LQLLVGEGVKGSSEGVASKPLLHLPDWGPSSSNYFVLAP